MAGLLRKSITVKELAMIMEETLGKDREWTFIGIRDATTGKEYRIVNVKACAPNLVLIEIAS